MVSTQNRPIGFYDSGVGGLTVLKEALRILPHESYIYIGDTEYLPYGTKSPELIKKLAKDIARTFLNYDIKALVVACNTVSAVALPEIQHILKTIPVIGVIDPTVSYTLSLASARCIGIIGTETTISSHVYEEKIHSKSHIPRTIISKATPLFVPLIEEHPHDHPLIPETVENYLKDLKNKHIDSLILGCTHYPMINHHIQAYLGDSVTIVDSAVPTIQTLKKILTVGHLIHEDEPTTKIFFTSDDPSRAIETAKNFLGENLQLQQLTIAHRTHD